MINLGNMQKLQSYKVKITKIIYGSDRSLIGISEFYFYVR